MTEIDYMLDLQQSTAIQNPEIQHSRSMGNFISRLGRPLLALGLAAGLTSVPAMAAAGETEPGASGPTTSSSNTEQCFDLHERLAVFNQSAITHVYDTSTRIATVNIIQRLCEPLYIKGVLYEATGSIWPQEKVDVSAYPPIQEAGTYKFSAPKSSKTGCYQEDIYAGEGGDIIVRDTLIGPGIEKGDDGLPTLAPDLLSNWSYGNPTAIQNPYNCGPEYPTTTTPNNSTTTTTTTTTTTPTTTTPNNSTTTTTPNNSTTSTTLPHSETSSTSTTTIPSVPNTVVKVPTGAPLNPTF